MGRTSYKNLQLFQKIVGSQSLKNVMLVTTHWSSAEGKDMHSREQELKTSFWQSMIKHGSQVSRHEGTVDSARNIASKLVNKSPIMPKITDELVKQKLRFSQTEAGKMVNEDLKAFGADMKDEINVISDRLKDMTKQREQDALTAKNEREQLEKELRTALQEAAKRDEARMEMQALNKRLANERRERLKDIEDLKREKERYEKLLDDTAKRQKQLKGAVKTRPPPSDSPRKNIIESYQVQTSSGFSRFVGLICWAAEMLCKIINFLVAMDQKHSLGGDVVLGMVVQWIFWIFFSFLFFSEGPKTLSLFIVICHLVYRLLVASNLIGYSKGASEERERNEASAKEQKTVLAITSAAEMSALQYKEQELARERKKLENKTRKLAENLARIILATAQ
ncbi:Nn.00g024620.m01.CDS01 [Neocucurbitaria sp. VM-36]